MYCYDQHQDQLLRPISTQDCCTSVNEVVACVLPIHIAMICKLAKPSAHSAASPCQSSHCPVQCFIFVRLCMLLSISSDQEKIGVLDARGPYFGSLLTFLLTSARGISLARFTHAHTKNEAHRLFSAFRVLLVSVSYFRARRQSTRSKPKSANSSRSATPSARGWTTPRRGASATSRRSRRSCGKHKPKRRRCRY